LIGEELGLIGVLIVLALFLWLFLKGFKIAMQTEDFFGYYLALGLTIMIGSQALINFGVSTGVVPTKGLPLPFISYGGSALLVNMAAVGILINISKNCCDSFLRSKEMINPVRRLRGGLLSNGVNRKTIYSDGLIRDRTCLDYFSLSDLRWRRYR
jgi:hypothetical protein